MNNELLENKKRFLKLIGKIKRKGIHQLIDWLEDDHNQVFTSPASSKSSRHNNEPGGLVKHSLVVYDNFKEKLKKLGLSLPNESVIIITLLHDICKAGTYVLSNATQHKWKKIDNLPLGHGEKSLFIVTQFIALTYSEAIAIRWHMGPFDPAYLLYQEFITDAGQKKLVGAIYLADYQASMEG